MRIDPKEKIGGHPVLTVRQLLRSLGGRLSWTPEDVEKALDIDAKAAGELIDALVAAGLIEIADGGKAKEWTVTALGQSFAAAKAGKPISRKTADKVLAGLLDRVREVNEDPY